MSPRIKTSDALAERIAELEDRLDRVSTASIKAEIGILKRAQLDTIAEELHERARLEQRLADETAELERAYDLAIASLVAYLDAADAVLALRPQWSRTWHEANREGADVPPRVPVFSARAARDADVRSAANRALATRFDF